MGYAANTYAKLTRQTWDDFIKTYQPWARELVDSTSYMDPTSVQENVDAALGRVNTAYDAMQGAQESALASYGVASTSEQSSERRRIGGIDRTAAIVDAANNIRAKIADRDRALATTGLPNVAGRTYGG